MLDFQTKYASFAFGVQEGQDPKSIPFGTLVTAENVVWKKGGRLEKRYGITPLNTPSYPLRLFVRGGELAYTDGTALWSRNVLSGWANLGNVPEVGIQWSVLLDQASGVRSADIALLSNGLVAHAWVKGDPGNFLTADAFTAVYFQTYDRSSGGTRPSGVTSVATTNVPASVKLVPNGAGYLALWLDGTKVQCWDGITVHTLANNATAGGAFDVVAAGANFIVAYDGGSGGAGSIQLSAYSFGSFTLGVVNSVAGGGAGGKPMALCVVGSQVFFGFYNTTLGHLLTSGFTTSTLVLAFSWTVDTVNVPVSMGYVASGAGAVISYTGAAASGTYFYGGTWTQMVIGASGVVAGSTRYSVGHLALSKPFVLGNGQVYLVLGEYQATVTATTNGPNPGTYPLQKQVQNISVVCVETLPLLSAVTSQVYPHRYMGRADVGIGGRWYGTHLPNAIAYSATESLTVVPVQTAQPTARQATHLLSMTVGAGLPADTWKSVQFDQELFIAAGVPCSYDGAQPVDYGFQNSAFFDSHATVVAAGGSIVAGTYFYVPQVEYRSATGMVYRSITDVPQSVVVGVTNDKVTLSICAPPLSNKSTSASVATGGIGNPAPASVIGIVYRSTLANPGSYFRESVEPDGTTIDFNPIQFSANPTTVVDFFADASIATIASNAVPLNTRPPLYNSGGELDDYQPPSALTCAFHRNRIWMLAGDGKTWWFSKDYSGNVGTAPGFHPTFILTFSEPMTAALTMDQALIFYGQRSIYYLQGDGPAPDGSASDYTDVNRIQTDIGCINPRSLVSTPDGHMFQSDRGLVLLDRSLAVSWIGKPVQDRLAAFPFITSAVVVPARREVRFSCNNAPIQTATAGIVLVYNYEEKQWSVFKYTIGNSPPLFTSVSSAPIADAILYNGVYTFVGGGPGVGVVKLETESTAQFFDEGVSATTGSGWIYVNLETSWVYADGPLGYQSVRNFMIDGVSQSNHQLTVEVGFDGNTSYSQPPQAASEEPTWQEGSPGVTAIGPVETAKVSIGPYRKCRQVRFHIFDGPPGTLIVYPLGSGQGMQFSSMGLEYGTMKGVGKVPAVQAR